MLQTAASCTHCCDALSERQAMVLSVVLVLLLMVIPTQAECADNQKCSGCDKTGQCTTECHTGYFGRKCKSPCNPACKNNACKAAGNGIEECTDGCIPGYGGVNCDIQCENNYTINDVYCLEVCNQHCRLSSNTNDTIRCLVHGESASVFCTSECHSQSGECLHGCVGGWYGPRCSSPCSAGCSGGRCDAAGACVDGCRPGYFGRDCQPCDRCKNHTCSSHNGSCVDGCITGYYGEFCNHSCEVCREGICDQMTGACVNGCDVSERGCRPSCTSNCSRDYCLHAQTCETDSSTDSKSNGVNIGLPTGCVVFILGVLVSHYICYRKGLAARRDRPGDDAVQPPSVEYQAWHKYCDIEEEDMDAGGQIQNGCQENYEEVRDLGMPVIAGVFPAPPAIVHRGDDSSSEISSSSTSRSCDPEIQNGNPEEDLDLGMSVIADVFPAAPAIVHRGDDTSSESTTSSTSRSYTHLIPDVVTEDPRTGDTYLSPVEDVVPSSEL